MPAPAAASDASDTTQLLLRWLRQSSGDDPTLIAAESQSTPTEPELELLASNEGPLTTETLLELGIVVSPLEAERSDAVRLGRPGQLTVDLVSGPGPAQVGRVVVTRHRLLRSQVHQAVTRWRTAWAQPGSNAPSKGSSGGLLWAKAASTDAVAGGASVSNLDTAAFERLKVGIADTYRHLMLAGLTPSELQASRTFVTNSLVARGADPAAVQLLLN